MTLKASRVERVRKMEAEGIHTDRRIMGMLDSWRIKPAATVNLLAAVGWTDERIANAVAAYTWGYTWVVAAMRGWSRERKRRFWQALDSACDALSRSRIM